MSKTYTGGCACGAVRYEKPGDTIAELHCQCLHCQQRSGTGHSSYLIFKARADLILTGEVKTWAIAGESGNVKNHAFCPTCGVPLFVTFEAMPEGIAIHPGSLDDASRLIPQFVTCAARAQPWDRVDQALKLFATMPVA